MASQKAGYDAWLVMLVAAIFVVGVSVYFGWDEAGVWWRKTRLFLFSVF